MQNNTWAYEIYGIIVVSNIQMLLLNEIDYSIETKYSSLNLLVSYGNVENTGISVEKLNADVYVLKINDLAHYTIDGRKNVIKCVASSYESFFSTLFNLPFSIYLAIKNSCLLHTCTLCHNDALVCLCGDKGIGKTTLSYLLQDESLAFFSDDTLAIDTENNIKRANNLVKMTSQTIEELNIVTQNKGLNASGKHYLYLKEDNIFPMKIDKILFLRRNNKNVINLKNIEQQVLRKAVIYHNIVGINYLPIDIIMRIDINLIFKDTPIYYLFIPNDLKLICSEKETIKKVILEK